MKNVPEGETCGTEIVGPETTYIFNYALVSTSHEMIQWFGITNSKTKAANELWDSAVKIGCLSK